MPDLPGGTVTFLFTDIEGSTRLLQRAGDQYGGILDMHRQILRSAFRDHGGTEVDTQGDAFFVSFPRARDAVLAAAQAQRTLNDHEWPGDVQVQVRMGLHTGEPAVVESGYVGMDVHRAARIAHAGHGGQVLLSPTTTSLISRDLPDGLRLADLGAHRLKDLRHPVTIHQLVIRDLPSTFPPLRTVDPLPNNLPAQLTSFVGRDAEIVEIKQLLIESRLVTIAGPGGSGKTRLSQQLAAHVLEQFDDGVWLIELETVDHPDDIALAIAAALRFSIDGHSSDLDPKRQLLDLLSDKSMLLVLDNFEHLLDGAGLLADILSECPNIRLLVTSREPLALPVEWVYQVAGMGFPENGARIDPEAYSSISLFIERARHSDQAFKPSQEALAEIARICQLVDGLPLAIELAAAWIRLLSPQEIGVEIEQGIDILESSMRGVPERHKSMRAVFDRSWQLLSEDLQEAFRRLAVFSGGFHREAAKTVAQVTLPTLLELAQKSLLQRDEGGRFELHPLLSDYAKEKLAEDPDQALTVRHAHSDYFIDYLASMQDEIQGERFQDLRDEVRREIGNVRSAIAWALENWEEHEALAAFRTYGRFAITEGFAVAAAQYQRLTERLRADGGSLEPAAPHRAVLAALTAYILQADETLADSEARALMEPCIAALRQLNLPFELGIALLAKGIRLEYLGKFEESIVALEESRDLLLESTDAFMIVACLTWLGWAHYELGDYDRAGEVFQHAHRVCLETGNLLGLPYALSKLGTWADARHEFKQGLDYHREAQQVFEAVGDQAGQGYAASRMSYSAWGLGDYEGARSYGHAGLDMFAPLNHRWGIATSLCRIGFAEVELGELANARSHFTEALRRSQADEMATTFNYAMIGLGAVWLAEGSQDMALEILTLAAEDPSTPDLYRDIARRYLTTIEDGLGSDRYLELRDQALLSDLYQVADRILRASPVVAD